MDLSRKSNLLFFFFLSLVLFFPFPCFGCSPQLIHTISVVDRDEPQSGHRFYFTLQSPPSSNQHFTLWDVKGERAKVLHWGVTSWNAHLSGYAGGFISIIWFLESNRTTRSGSLDWLLYALCEWVFQMCTDVQQNGAEMTKILERTHEDGIVWIANMIGDVGVCLRASRRCGP